MSTGLIYVPGTYSETDELIEIAKVVARHQGIYASHIRNEGTDLLSAVDEAIRIGREAQLPVHVSHFKSSGRDAWGLVRRAVTQIETARGQGQIVTADQYPYIASSTSLDATILPSWALAGGRKELIKRLDDPKLNARIEQAIAGNLEKRDGGTAIRIARYAPRQDWVGKNLAEIAEAENKTPMQIGVEIARNGGAAIVNFSMDEADVRHVMQVPWVATASDGRGYLPGADKPHPRNYGTFTRKIGQNSIEEKVIPLETAIRSATSLPAEILGLTDRGVLQKGMAADIVVFDPTKIRDAATFDDPHQYSRGIEYVFVNGQPAIHHGSPTGARPGKALVHSPKQK
jgi:N-acyl-D-aspartate/D-glutamate deacylase